jgi:hypothetical protein
MEYCIVYLSSSRKLLSDEDLLQILTTSRQNNLAANVTGVLLYFNGSIIQVLEGEKQAVINLYNRISADPRHVQVMPLYMREIEERSFAEWSMGFSTLNARELNHITELQPVINDPHAPAADVDNTVLTLLKNFYRNNYRN